MGKSSPPYRAAEPSSKCHHILSLDPTSPTHKLFLLTLYTIQKAITEDQPGASNTILETEMTKLTSSNYS